MLDYITLKSTNGYYYNVKVRSSYIENKAVKKIKEIKKESNECLSFFQQLLML
jgi:hypothetical protein